MKKRPKKAKAKITSKNYHDYVIKNGKFIGEFEEMYRNVDDPWLHGRAQGISYDISLYLIDKFKICSKGGRILDIGSGKGAFTYRIKKQCPKAKILAVDISPTAIRKAKSKYSKNGILFEVMDIQKEYKDIKEKFDLIIMSNVMWYILYDFEKITNYLKKNLKNKGYLLIRQAFYNHGKQKYGNKIVSSPEDMVDLIKLKLIERIDIHKINDFSSVIIFNKYGDKRKYA